MKVRSLSRIATLLLLGCNWFDGNEPRPPKLNVVWQAPVAVPSAGVPATFGDGVIAAFEDRRVRAFDVASGSLRWTSPDLGKNLFPSRIHVSADSVVIVNGGDTVFGLDALTGAMLWSRESPPDLSYSIDGSVLGGLAYNNLALADDGKHLAVPAWGTTLMMLGTRDGHVVWTWNGEESHERRHGASGARHCGSLLIVSYWRFITPNGTQSTHGLVALDPQTGRELWRRPFPFTSISVPTFGALTCNNQNVFAATIGGPLWSVRLSDGKIDWSAERTSGYINYVGPTLVHNLVVSDNGISNEIVARRATDGLIVWKTNVGSVPVSQIQEDDDFIWFTDGGYLHLLRVASGERVLRSDNSDIAILYAPLPLGGRHAILATEHGLMRIRIDGIK